MPCIDTLLVEHMVSEADFHRTFSKCTVKHQLYVGRGCGLAVLSVGHERQLWCRVAGRGFDPRVGQEFDLGFFLLQIESKSCADSLKVLA